MEFIELVVKRQTLMLKNELTLSSEVRVQIKTTVFFRTYVTKTKGKEIQFDLVHRTYSSRSMSCVFISHTVNTHLKFKSISSYRPIETNNISITSLLPLFFLCIIQCDRNRYRRQKSENRNSLCANACLPLTETEDVFMRRK